MAVSPDPFFGLPRTTRPADWFERILPALPLRLPAVTTPMWSVYHIHGVGGGSWSVRLVDGRVQTQAGVATPVGMQLSMTTAHFREAIGGALRERLAHVLRAWGRPVALPDASRVPLDVSRLQAAAAVGGSMALVLQDREVDDAYRYVLTLGDGAAAWESPRTTIETGLDDLTALLVARTPPLQLVASGKLRVQGDVDLPLRALRTLLG